MKRPSQHVTDDQAQALLQLAWPDWVFNKRTRDYGKDFTVEVVEDEQVTGLELIVQLKGTRRRLHARDGHISFSLGTKYLKHYLACRLPVFLVVMHVEEKRGYWLFLQQYEQERLRQRQWSQQKTVTVRLPVNNQVSDMDQLRIAVQSADAFMASYRPGAIRPAIEAEQVSYESLDPRFKVKIEATDSYTHRRLIAQEDVSSSFVLRDPKKAEDLFERGLEIELEQGDLSVTGSPLLAKITEEAKAIRIHKSYPCSVRILVGEESDRPRPAIGPFDGTFEGGMSEMRFAAALPSGVFKLGIVFCIDRSKKDEATTHVDMAFRPAAWQGTPLSKLPYFSEMDAVFRVLFREVPLQIEILRDGVCEYVLPLLSCHAFQVESRRVVL